MKLPLPQDVPKWTALALAAAAVLASVVAGRESEQPAAPAPSGVRAQPPGPARAPALDLDLEIVKREARRETISDLFVPRSWEPALAPAAPGAKQRASVAPPLPFTYLGRLLDGDRTSVFLARGAQTYSVEPGQRIDDSYRLEQATAAELTFTYLPLGIRQALPIPPVN
jgi:hypothetical protein